LKSKLTQDGSLGSPRALLITFGVGILNSVERIHNKDLGGSVLLDIGIYKKSILFHLLSIHLFMFKTCLVNGLGLEALRMFF